MIDTLKFEYKSRQRIPFDSLPTLSLRAIQELSYPHTIHLSALLTSTSQLQHLPQNIKYNFNISTFPSRIYSFLSRLKHKENDSEQEKRDIDNIFKRGGEERKRDTAEMFRRTKWGLVILAESTSGFREVYMLVVERYKGSEVEYERLGTLVVGASLEAVRRWMGVERRSVRLV
jgi:hypothetical protein